MKTSDIPNLISFIRLLLIAPVVWLLLQGEFATALALFVIAGLSDAIDGYLARRYDWKSHLGGWLDPLADKAMQVSVYVTVTWLNLIPAWLLAAVIVRDIVIVAGGFYYYYRVQRVNAAPTALSKINTLMQILLIVILLVHYGLQPLPELWLEGLIYLVLVTTILSGLDYVFTWGRKAWLVKQGEKT